MELSGNERSKKTTVREKRDKRERETGGRGRAPRIKVEGKREMKSVGM